MGAFRSRLRIASAAAALTIALAAPGSTEDAKPGAMIRLQYPGKAAAAAKPADVAWLVGSWVGDMEGMGVEHVILPERHGQIPGFVRAAGGSDIVFYEITTFVPVGNSMSYRVKHFTPALAGWEGQNAFVDRPLVERSTDGLFFDGITFQRTGQDGFTVHFWDRDRKRTIVIPFRRAPAP